MCRRSCTTTRLSTTSSSPLPDRHSLIPIFSPLFIYLPTRTALYAAALLAQSRETSSRTTVSPSSWGLCRSRGAPGGRAVPAAISKAEADSDGLLARPADAAGAGFRPEPLRHRGGTERTRQTAITDGDAGGLLLITVVSVRVPVYPREYRTWKQAGASRSSDTTILMEAVVMRVDRVGQSVREIDPVCH